MSQQKLRPPSLFWFEFSYTFVLSCECPHSKDFPPNAIKKMHAVTAVINAAHFTNPKDTKIWSTQSLGPIKPIQQLSSVVIDITMTVIGHVGTFLLLQS